MPKTFYKASFSDGHIETRSTEQRAYAWCWRIAGTYAISDTRWSGKPWDRSGWSSTKALADKAMNYEGPADRTFAEVAPAVLITGTEYRSLRQSKAA